MTEPAPLKFSTKERRKPIPVEIDGETFSMHPVPGMVFKDFLALSMRPDPDDDAAKMRKDSEEVGALFDIFEQCMDEATYERFSKFARSPHGPDILTLTEVITAVVEASAKGFPTQSPSPSARGRRKTGTGSTGAASSAAST